MKPQLNQLTDQFNSLKNDEAKKFLPRLWSILLAAWTLGKLQAILAIAFISIAFSTFVADRIEKFAEAKEIKRVNAAIIGSDQEPRRINVKPGIVSVVLSQLDVQDSSSDNNSILRALLDSLHKSTITIPSIREIGFYPISKFEQTGFKLIQKSIVIETTENTNILIPATEYQVPDPLLYDQDELMRDTLLAILEKYKNQSIDSIEHKDFESFFDKNSFSYFKAALRLSQLNMDSLPKKIPQCYFVSMNGVFSHQVKNNSMALLEVTKRSPFHRWEASSYVQQYFNSNDQIHVSKIYESKVYIDISGLGLVKTYSIPYVEDGVVLGLLCMDEVIETMQIIPDKFRGEFQQKQAKNRDSLTFKWTNNVFDFKLSHLEHPNPKVQNEHHLVRSSTSEDGITEYQIPIKNTDESIDTLTISPVSISTFSGISPKMWLCFLLANIGLFFMYLSLSRLMLNNEQSRIANILRNLPIGVLQLEAQNHNKHERIVAANDHAEELFGETLNRFGEVITPHSKNAAYFHEFVDLTRIFIRPNEWDDAFIEEQYENIMKDGRLQSETTSYFASLKQKTKDEKSEAFTWVEITGSPLINAETGEIDSFGIFRLVRNKVWEKRLDCLMNKTPKSTHKPTAQ